MVGLSMAFNPMSALIGAKVGQMNNPFNILSNSIQNGANAGNALMHLLYGPQAYQDSHKAAMANLAAQNIKNQYMPQSLQSTIGLQQAQAAKDNLNVEHPLLSVGSSPAAQQGALALVAQQYGEGSPQYQQLKNAIQAKQDYTKKKGDYYAANVTLKNLPTPVKNSLIAQGQGINTIIPEQQTQQTKQAAQDAFIKGTVPTQIQNQRYYAITARNIYNNGLKYLPDASTFSGFNGSLDRFMQGLQSGTGANMPQYENWLKFRQNAKVLANETRRMLGGQATDQEAKTLDALVNPSSYNISPQQFVALYQSLPQIMDSTDKSLMMSPSQVGNQLKNNTSISAGLSQPYKGYSAAHIEEYAKARGITIGQVKSMIDRLKGGKGG